MVASGGTFANVLPLPLRWVTSDVSVDFLWNVLIPQRRPNRFLSPLLGRILLSFRPLLGLVTSLRPPDLPVKNWWLLVAFAGARRRRRRWHV